MGFLSLYKHALARPTRNTFNGPQKRLWDNVLPWPSAKTGQRARILLGRLKSWGVKDIDHGGNSSYSRSSWFRWVHPALQGRGKEQFAHGSTEIPLVTCGDQSNLVESTWKILLKPTWIFLRGNGQKAIQPRPSLRFIYAGKRGHFSCCRNVFKLSLNLQILNQGERTRSSKISSPLSSPLQKRIMN